ncbi:MAG: FkbM family methyltransferase [Ideonella sp.]|jgi:FkbM family methyltransferase|nr:FkbM family methyltransferase [Ideonella sp.]
MNAMQKDLVYDVGLHVGQDTDYYLKKGFRVVAIEANPLLVTECTERFAFAVATGRLTIVNVGIAQEEGILPFYVNDQLSEWSSFNHQIGTTRGPYHVIQVPVTTLEKVMAKHGVPYYLKIDIEGLDLAAVQSLRPLPDKPRHVSLENGEKHLIDELYEQGYRRFKFVNQAKIHEIRLHPPAREGLYVDHQFPFGASGPFGDETDGPWLDRAAVTALSEAYWNNPNRDANIHGWYDLHATF